MMRSARYNRHGANAHLTVWSVGLDPFLFSGTAVCEPVPSDCATHIAVVDKITQTVRRRDGVESTSTVPANVHPIGEPHPRPLSETPIGDPHRRPSTPSSWSPVGHLCDSAAFVGNTCGDRRSQ